MCSQNECIKGGDACNIATPADEVCTLQCNSCAQCDIFAHFVAHTI